MERQVNRMPCQSRIQYQAAAAKYLDREHGHPVPPDRSAFPLLSEQDFARERRQNVMLRAYTAQAMTNVMRYGGLSEGVFALFSPKGYLLKLYGGPEQLEWAAAAGLRLGSVWNCDSIGLNAVSVGLEEDEPLTSVGEENDQAGLKELAIYFAPVSEVFRDNSQIKNLGGMAVILPKERVGEEFMALALSITSEVSLHISMSSDIFAMYGNTPKCMMLLDINPKTGKVTINHHNDRVFDMFSIQPYDLYFSPATDLFDPAPKNQRFWESIAKGEDLKEQELVLSLQGNEVDCIVTTSYRDRPHIPSTSVIVTIESRQQVVTVLSEKINHAPLAFENIVGRSPVLKSAIKRSTLLANTDSNIMIFGESGVGKDIFAQAIHNAGRRKGKPFIAVNCGALPRDLINSELFGYESGAFTGARKQGNIGKFELANGGTIFLDEIGEMPLDLQATLLRVVEQKKLTRLGGSKLIDVDVKIISATNADLSLLVKQQRFRADLFYRLSTVALNLPPLRERGDDVVLLAEHFIRSVSRRIGREDVMRISPEAKALLLQLPWKGNVRELQNLIEGIVQLYSDPELRPEHIMENLSALSRSGIQTQTGCPPMAPTVAPPPRQALTAEDILTALSACGGNRSEAARYLGVARKTLYRNMERLGLSGKDK